MIEYKDPNPTKVGEVWAGLTGELHICWYRCQPQSHSNWVLFRFHFGQLQVWIYSRTNCLGWARTQLDLNHELHLERKVCLARDLDHLTKASTREQFFSPCLPSSMFLSGPQIWQTPSPNGPLVKATRWMTENRRSFFLFPFLFLEFNRPQIELSTFLVELEIFFIFSRFQ